MALEPRLERTRPNKAKFHLVTMSEIGPPLRAAPRLLAALDLVKLCANDPPFNAGEDLRHFNASFEQASRLPSVSDRLELTAAGRAMRTLDSEVEVPGRRRGES